MLLNSDDPDLEVLTQDVPTSIVFAILRSPAPNSTYSLYNVGAATGAISGRYSNWWDENRDCKVVETELTTIDHMLVSYGLLTDSLTSAEYAKPFEFSCEDEVCSDHLPVVAVFDTSNVRLKFCYFLC